MQVFMIEDILTEDQRASRIQDAVLFESELQKYRPGLSIHYISRWCQCTRGQFMYFKNQWSANCWLGKPILAIPIKHIQAVRRVFVAFADPKQNSAPTPTSTSNSKLQQKRKPQAQRNPKLEFLQEPVSALDEHQFELFLKPDVNLLTLTRINDSTAYDLKLRAEEQQQRSQTPVKSLNSSSVPPRNIPFDRIL